MVEKQWYGKKGNGRARKERCHLSWAKRNEKYFAKKQREVMQAFMIKAKQPSWEQVAHTCNPTNLGG
jgi:hypothetical protein